MASNLTFYAAWQNQGDTTFLPSYARFDEQVFSFDLEHLEGQIPQLRLQVINPRVGLLGPTRKYWLWLSYSPDGGTTIIPLFFGRLVGIPTSILANVIEMTFIARPIDYIYQRQQVAESLKTLPNYDPVFFTIDKRDDPDAILEGWSSLYHVGRTDSKVTASDILTGEDGTIAFATQDTFYDSVKMKLLQSPLVAVVVKAEVTWRQQWRGHFFVGQWSYPTFGNEPFVQAWPQTGTSIGGGYWAGTAYAGEIDPSITQATLDDWNKEASVQYTWQNTAKHHQTGDTMSISISMSYPITASGAAFQYVTVKEVHTGGQIIPLTYDGFGNVLGPLDSNGDPAPVNTPNYDELDQFAYRALSSDKTAVGVLDLVYQADRQRTERLDLTVQAAVQPILIDPLVTEDTETITVKSSDLSQPLIDMVNWSSVAGQAVNVGEIIFPDNPLVPGQTSSQICVTAGTTGTVEPIFSNVSGTTVTDGTAVWASMGMTAPPEMVPDWSRVAPVAVGTMLLPKPVMGVADQATKLIPGSLNYPPSSVPVALYDVMAVSGDAMPGSAMMECSQGGLMGGLSAQSTGATLATFNDFVNPSGQTLYICVQGGVTGQFRSTFNETAGAQTTDGTAVWQAIGPVTLPIGGSPGLTPAACYFPTDRGLQSLEHLICRARAKLRKRARAVEVSADVRFEAAASAAISCRMNASLVDVRLPGGGATGKVIAYKLSADGDSGKVSANVTLGCTIGQAGTVPAATGAETYVAAGYVATSYQFMSGSTLLAGTADVGYAPPAQQTVDDGLSFPLSGASDVVLTSQWNGVQTSMNTAAIDLFNQQLTSKVQEAVLEAKSGAGTSVAVVGVGGDVSETTNIPTVDWYAINQSIQTKVLQDLLQGTALWYELALKPLTGGPYGAAYAVATTPLIVPETIDLSAPSSGG